MLKIFRFYDMFKPIKSWFKDFFKYISNIGSISYSRQLYSSVNLEMSYNLGAQYN